MAYRVLVDDNFHYMDADERYEHGSFATLEEAIAAARRIVDECLAGAWHAGMSADELLTSYAFFGEDPFIVGDDVSGVPFSARDYARERCAKLCPAPRDR